MKQQELKIGNLVWHVGLGVSEIAGLTSSGFYLINPNNRQERVFFEALSHRIEPIQINEEWLLKFGFKKIEETNDDYTEIQYELETPEVYFNYSDDWSIAIADSKKTFLDTGNYIAPSTKISDKVHLLQNLFYSLTGKEIYEN